MVLIDTSVLIEYFRKQDKAKTFLYDLAGKHTEIYVSTIPKFEIWVGNRPHQSVFWQNLFSSLKTLPFGDAEAEKAGDIQQMLLKTGQQNGISDVLIGATALIHGLPVATLNDKHFGRINGLTVIQKP
ncbi:MAG: Ribonuclease VapC10 [Saprospiraceae bacterium]|nr:Ribonuclease VapC10 [Saprospiraceae bacterium]